MPTQGTLTGTAATATEGDMTLNIMQLYFVNGQNERAQGFLETQGWQILPCSPPLRQAQKKCPVQKKPQNLCSTLSTGHKTLPTPTRPQTSRPTSLLQGTSGTPGTMVPKTWRSLAALPGLTPRHYGPGDQIPTWGADSSSCQGNR